MRCWEPTEGGEGMDEAGGEGMDESRGVGMNESGAIGMHAPDVAQTQGMRPPRQRRRGWALLGLALALGLALLFGPQAGAREGGPEPQAPTLVLEAGMHTAPIRSASVDREGRWLLTGSNDKTARLWDLRSGALLRTFRIPVAAGSVGKVYAVALSPEGDRVAVGGYTARDRDVQPVYVFDRATGALLQTLGGHGNVAHCLAFSPDGESLAVGLGGTAGLVVWDALSGERRFADGDYEDTIHGCDYDARGRLLTSSWDGHLRLYGPKGGAPRKVGGLGGEKPVRVRFSPDGARVAVGYEDAPRVEVRDGETLALLFTPDLAGVGNGSLSRVAWSEDGGALYAGGQMRDGSGHPIRRWPEGGRGAPRDLRPGADNTLFELLPLPLPGGGLVWASADPAWGVLGEEGRPEEPHRAPIADFRGQDDTLSVDATGGIVAFGLTKGGGDPHRFDVPGLRLTSLGEAPPGTALTTREGLAVVGWKNGYAPTLKGRPLTLKAYEMSRALALHPSEPRFALGTSQSVRLFDGEGQELWRFAAPAEAWAVAFSGDGNLIVGAFADGTLRWLRASDGALLLSLFPHANGRDWVAWTPSGYFDASPGGEALVGWLVPQGEGEMPLFHPASRYRDTYYRPDVVARVLKDLDERRALARANAALGAPPPQAVSVVEGQPPVVTLLSPARGETFSASPLRAEALIHSPSGAAIEEVRFMVDGRPARPLTGAALQGALVPVPGKRHTYKVGVDLGLSPRDATISVVARTFLATSEPAAAPIAWALPEAAAPALPKPRLFVLAVGVNDPTTRLTFAESDARRLGEAWSRQTGGLYGDVEVKTLTGAAANPGEILKGLGWLEKESRSEDVVLLFLAGHGQADPRSGEYLYAAYGADPDNPRGTYLWDSALRSALRTLPGKVLVFLDTCYAGDAGLLSTQNLNLVAYRGPGDLSALINKLSDAGNGVLAFGATRAGQLSAEGAQWGGGVYTHALLAGLGGAADTNRDGAIYWKELDSYLTRTVEGLTEGKQVPVSGIPPGMDDFPIAVPQAAPKAPRAEGGRRGQN